MRIYAFTSFYPSLYKPYYDVHFADLVAQGHDLTILASGTLGDSTSERARRSGLVQRTRYFIPDELRHVVWRAPSLARRLLGGRGAALRAAVRAGSNVKGVRGRIKAAARAVLLPRETPDLCIVHSHETLRLVPWLHRIYADTPVILYYYGGIPPEAGGRVSGHQITAALRGVDVIFTCSAYSRDEVIELGAAPDRVRVLPLGFDLEDFRPPEPREYRTDGTVRLLSVGRLSHGKGHEDALEAMHLLSRSERDLRLRYTIVGGGVLRGELESRVRDLGLAARVTFTGPLDNQLVRKLYAESDALILSSFATDGWAETQGTVIQEAMLMKALVVTTRTGGVGDSVPPWMERFQVPERSPRDLADALRRVARMDTSEMARLGTMSRDWVLDRFDVRDFNRSLLQQSSSARNRP